METIIDRLITGVGRYEGTGDGIESGPFNATIEIATLLDGMGASIDYIATGPDDTELHREHTVVAFDMWSGEATLYVLCAELSGVGQLVQASGSTFTNGQGTDGFELQIEIVIADRLEYIWSWGQPGEPLIEQSRAVFPLQ
ncbi:MAG TPA: hypothetical protein VMY16_00480 [Ilumatobacteraceae bacterium]|nr:hypothetical protein [Ilumatobacteraceae bacterium]